jgi:mRNA interferase MazF
MNKNPKRGEIWFVDFNPTKGKEIQKIRPAVVISSDYIGKLPLKLVIPITEWQDVFKENIWHVQLIPSAENGLKKASAVDALQTRSVDVLRFKNKIGSIKDGQLLDILQALAAVVELV